MYVIKEVLFFRNSEEPIINDEPFDRLYAEDTINDKPQEAIYLDQSVLYFNLRIVKLKKPVI